MAPVTSAASKPTYTPLEKKQMHDLGALLPFTRPGTAKSPDATPELLDHLAGDSNVETRRNVAANPNTARATLDKLSTDTDSDVRLAVASHKNTPSSVLAKLA